MNLNKFHKFVFDCKNLPKEDKSIAIYEDFFSPTGLYLEYSNLSFRVIYQSSNYYSISESKSLDSFNSEVFLQLIESLHDDAYSKIKDWKSGYSVAVLDYVLASTQQIIEELQDSGLCSLDEENKRDTTKKLFNLGKPLFVHIIKLLRYKDKLNGWHHIDDINNWIREISDIIIDSDFNFSSSTLLELLYLEYNTEKTISYLDRPDKYGQLPIQLDSEELLKAVNSLYISLADKLSSKETDLDILNLVKEVLPELEIEYNYPNPEGSRKKSRKSKRKQK